MWYLVASVSFVFIMYLTAGVLASDIPLSEMKIPVGTTEMYSVDDKQVFPAGWPVYGVLVNKFVVPLVGATV